MTQPIIPDLAQIPVGMTAWVRAVAAAIRQMQAQLSVPTVTKSASRFPSPFTVMGPGGVPVITLGVADPNIQGDGALLQFYEPYGTVDAGIYVPYVTESPGLGMYIYAGSIPDTNYLNLTDNDQGGAAQLFAASSWILLDNGGIALTSSYDVYISSNGNLTLYVPGTFTLNAGAYVDFSPASIILGPPGNTLSNAANVYQDPTTGAFYRSTSARKYKVLIRDAPLAAAQHLLNNLKAVTFKDRGEVKTTSLAEAPLHSGFIAEDVADIAGSGPYVDTITDDEGNKIPESVHYATLVVPLVQAYQAQQAEIADLRARIEALEAR